MIAQPSQTALRNDNYQPAMLQPSGMSQDGEGHSIAAFNPAYYRIVSSVTSTPNVAMCRQPDDGKAVETALFQKTIGADDCPTTPDLEWDEIISGAEIVRRSLLENVSDGEVCDIKKMFFLSFVSLYFFF